MAMGTRSKPVNGRLEASDCASGAWLDVVWAIGLVVGVCVGAVGVALSWPDEGACVTGACVTGVVVAGGVVSGGATDGTSVVVIGGVSGGVTGTLPVSSG